MLSIVVCTYNRDQILKECLESCLQNYKETYPVELVVVDNNSSDETPSIVNEIKGDNDWIKYVFEKNQGLSIARNTGYKAASYDWVLYLDDDAKIDVSFFDRIEYLVTNTGYRVIGGLYLPWYKYGKPQWYKDSYASNKNSYEDITVLRGNEYACGGIFLIQKELLVSQNGFSTDFGMNGNQVAYGEEDDLQGRLRESGIEIAYDPFLIIHHLVPKYKLNVRWFLKSSYKLGLTYAQASGYPHNKLTGLLALGIGIAQCLIYSILSAFKLLGKNYYKENFVIDVLKKPLKWIGVFKSAWF
jgi:glycosyltransferase involved in cell wall biosynthesis